MRTPRVLAAIASPDVLDSALDNQRHPERTQIPLASHSALLLRGALPQVVQKLAKELVECLIEAMAGNMPCPRRRERRVLYSLLIPGEMRESIREVLAAHPAEGRSAI